MSTASPPPFPRLYVLAACIVLVLGSMMVSLLPQPQSAAPVASLEIETEELPLVAGLYPEPPPALLHQSASGYRALLTPSPTPQPQPPRFPWWVQSKKALDLGESRGSRAPLSSLIPEGSYLRVIDGLDGRLKVHYSGDGSERLALDGWVGLADVVASPAPRWVMSTRGTGLRRGPGPGAPLSEWLLGRTVLEVLEDRGKELRVFHLGDGRTREAEEGWVDTADLVAAGAMLAAESRGARLLSRADAATLRSGDGLWLKVPYRTQLDGGPSQSANCGPSSVGMAMEYLGVYAPTSDLRALANKLMGTLDPEAGVAIEDLQAIAERYGLATHDLYLDGQGQQFKRWTLEDVRKHLRLGHPVIPELRFRLMPGRERADYYDHYVVLLGLRGDDFLYNDSADSDGPGYGRVMSSEALLRAWRGSEYPLVAFALSRP